MGDLCLWCKEDGRQRYHGAEMIPRHVHCHHEPKECWCQSRNTIDLMENSQAKVSIHGMMVKRNFCPECGRKF